MCGGAGSDETPWPKDQLATPVPLAAPRAARAGAAAAPVAASDVYSLGVITVTPEHMAYSQQRAPLGEEIDAVVVQRKTRSARA